MRVFVNGSVPAVLKKSTRFLATMGGEVKQFDAGDTAMYSKTKIVRVNRQFSDEASHNYAMSYKDFTLPEWAAITKGERGNRRLEDKLAMIEQDMIFIGIVACKDQEKKDARGTIESIMTGEVTCHLISRDNEKSAVAIAQRCGFI